MMNNLIETTKNVYLTSPYQIYLYFCIHLELTVIIITLLLINYNIPMFIGRNFLK